ncbi:MAG: hypothetical protein IKY27_05115 [Bacteroidales bacterium]|nr:hypothetical protein [Bacteroidales bacterium]MBR5781346.1 hypothetical protein [Bacteroidales bacterium]
MIGEVNQDNLYLILPSKVSALANMLVEYKGVTIIDAIRQIYASKLYIKLQDESSKMWHWGPVALYEELEEEVIE